MVAAAAAAAATAVVAMILCFVSFVWFLSFSHSFRQVCVCDEFEILCHPKDLDVKHLHQSNVLLQNMLSSHQKPQLNSN